MSTDQAPQAAEHPQGFGTFAGVYRPIVLTIMGAMLYLREGWLVGNTGLLGALLVLGVAYAITGTTAMSLASIASNVRVRPGGAFAIVAQALGLEAGGAIGLPLYIAQAASSAMYIYAFTEAWAYVFPSHPAGLVAGLSFAAVALLAWRSAGLAFRAQAAMGLVVILALSSAAAGLGAVESLQRPQLVGRLEDANLVQTFAIFFPAATGIMVGAGMSGSLADPRRAIPRGTLLAWGTTLVLYASFAVWYSLMATPDELVSNKTLIIDRALFPPLVLAGLLCSTLMAALSSLVAAPRLLQAMAEHGVLPASSWLRRTTPAGEPRNAVLATTGLAALGLAAGSLDAIAPIITSFFIMTYLAINAVVYLEQILDMISFRPTFAISRVVPMAGALLCLGGLSLASPFGGLLEVGLVLAIYVVLSRRKLDTPWETVRSGIAVTLASWAARRAAHIERSERAWKPDLLVPVATVEQTRQMRPLVESLGMHGSIRWVALGPREDLVPHLQQTTREELQAGHHASWTQLHTSEYMAGLGLAMDALRGALFPPNLVLVDERKVDDEELAAYLEHCVRLEVGLAIWDRHPHPPPGLPERIVVWLSDRSPDWPLQLHVQNLDLPVLIGLLLARRFSARLCLATVLRDHSQQEGAERFFARLIDQARLPADTEMWVGTGEFHDGLSAVPNAPIHLFGMSPRMSKERLQQVQDASGASCLWLLDSGRESALA